jgi:hypothetical protein
MLPRAQAFEELLRGRCLSTPFAKALREERLATARRKGDVKELEARDLWYTISKTRYLWAAIEL